MKRNRQYDCEVCRSREDFKRNQAEGCFLEYGYVLVPFPDFELTGGQWRITEEKRIIYCEPDDFIELLSYIQMKYPGKPVGAIWLDMYSGLCPVSFISPEINSWIELETAVSEYGCLPEKGGYVDQAAWLMEVFDTIRAAKNGYYLWKSQQKEK